MSTGSATTTDTSARSGSSEAVSIMELRKTSKGKDALGVGKRNKEGVPVRRERQWDVNEREMYLN